MFVIQLSRLKNHLVKSLISFLLVLLAANVTSAQSAQCGLANAPLLQDLRLGMSPVEVQNAVGGDLKIKVKTKGDRTFFQNYIKKSATGPLSGVRALYLRFLDGRLYQIEIFYEERGDIPTLEAFTKNLAAQMNFPVNEWQFVKNKAVIDCGAFTLVADKVLNPHVELTDSAMQTEAVERRKKKNK